MSAIPHLKMQSPDGVATNVAAIRQLFPNCVTETIDDATGELKYAVDFDQLRQELSGDIVEGPKERYQLTWPGKRKAILTANAPIRKTLRPARDESVDFDTTQNLFIEGDNLDALKLLQETYLGKVKMIYIDPPYNTGKDFVYKDDFKQSTAEYLEASGQRDEERNRLELNSDSNGRYHSDWLTMMYSRLKIARNLLREDGVVFISLDDVEASNAIKLCENLFGAENFVADLIWQSRTSISDDHEISKNHNHTIIFAKSKSDLVFKGESLDSTDYINRDNDPRGPWKLVPLDANKPGGNTIYPIRNPSTGQDYLPPNGRSWAINPQSYEALLQDNRIAFGIKGESAPKKKLFLKERIARGDSKTPSSILLNAGVTKDGTSEVKRLFANKKLFDYPKPISFIYRLLQYGTSRSKEDLILDFFAGSATTGHAVMKLNAGDGGNRKYICIQLPETTPEKSEARKAGYETIADIAKERLRRAGKKIKEEHPEWQGDTGFRVLKVDTTSMEDVYYSPSETQQAELLGLVDNIKQDRSPEDLLFQVMLDMGVPLDLPIERKTVEGIEIFVVGHNDLVACFAERLTEKAVKAIAKLQPMRVVLKDKAFTSDSAKINAEQVRKHFAPESELRVL